MNKKSENTKQAADRLVKCIRRQTVRCHIFMDTSRD